jgi:membrane protease YdiL (CAAX protease family)
VRIALLTFLGLHVVHALWLNRRQDRVSSKRDNRVSLYLIQVPLFVLGCIIAYQDGAVGRGLVNPLTITAGLVLGHVIFVLSLLVVHRSARDAREVLLGVRSIWDFAIESPLVLSRYVGVAVTEEVIYRAAAQQTLNAYLGAPWAGIVIVAVLFSVVHAHFFRNTFSQSLEFVVFAVLLGVLYWRFESLLFVIAIHAIRNIEIAYLEFLGKLEELGDEEAALHEIEQSVLQKKSGLA